MTNPAPIQAVYDRVPEVACKGLCQSACGPIGCSGAEATALQDNGIALPTITDHPTNGPLTCSHLNADGRCGIYDQRPLICRLYATVRFMVCPHGCRPKRFLSDPEARGMMHDLDALSSAPQHVAI